MTSLAIVEMINKERAGLFANGKIKKYTELRHDHFMVKVVAVLGEESAPKFLGADEYEKGKGAIGTRDIYLLPKREATLMAMSYSHQVSANVYDEMTRLEGVVAAQNVPALPNFSNPAEAARAWALEYQLQNLLE